jgi:hypothetical protein
VPHHHHNGLAYFISSNIPNEESGNNKSNDQPNDKDDDTNCILRQTVIIPSNTGVVPGPLLKIKNPENLNRLVTLSSSDWIPDFCTLFDYQYYNNISSLYSFQLNNSRGLRAPPLS